jgi:hypothetical protein
MKRLFLATVFSHPAPQNLGLAPLSAFSARIPDLHSLMLVL